MALWVFLGFEGRKILVFGRKHGFGRGIENEIEWGIKFRIWVSVGIFEFRCRNADTVTVILASTVGDSITVWTLSIRLPYRPPTS
jgi:hypothetical protein